MQVVNSEVEIYMSALVTGFAPSIKFKLRRAICSQCNSKGQNQLGQNPQIQLVKKYNQEPGGGATSVCLVRPNPIEWRLILILKEKSHEVDDFKGSDTPRNNYVLLGLKLGGDEL